MRFKFQDVVDFVHGQIPIMNKQQWLGENYRWFDERSIKLFVHIILVLYVLGFFRKILINSRRAIYHIYVVGKGGMYTYMKFV